MEGLTLKGVTSGLGVKTLLGSTVLEHEIAVMKEKLFLSIRKTTANDSQKFGLIYQGRQ